jgi:hypothetical protein
VINFQRNGMFLWVYLDVKEDIHSNVASCLISCSRCSVWWRTRVLVKFVLCAAMSVDTWQGVPIRWKSTPGATQENDLSNVNFVVGHLLISVGCRHMSVFIQGKAHSVVNTVIVPLNNFLILTNICSAGILKNNEILEGLDDNCW